MERIVVCSELSREYGSFPALDGVSLSLYGGRTVALIGDSGSGKSTFLRLLAGLDKPTRGDVYICARVPSVDTREFTAYLPDNGLLEPSLTPDAAVRLFSRYYEDFDAGAAIKILTECGLDLIKPIGGASKGERAAAELALVLSRGAKLFLLDEPFVALDGRLQGIFADEVKTRAEGGACLLLSGGSWDSIPLETDDVLWLRSGTVVDYAPSEEVLRQC